MTGRYLDRVSGPITFLAVTNHRRPYGRTSRHLAYPERRALVVCRVSNARPEAPSTAICHDLDARPEMRCKINVLRFRSANYSSRPSQTVSASTPSMLLVHANVTLCLFRIVFVSLVTFSKWRLLIIRALRSVDSLSAPACPQSLGDRWSPLRIRLFGVTLATRSVYAHAAFHQFFAHTAAMNASISSWRVVCY